MSTISKTKVKTPWDGPIRVWRWSGLANGDDGEPLNLAEYADRSIHVTGTFGTGGTLLFEGSNAVETESPTYITLSDPQGNALSFTVAGLEQILEACYLIRPRVSAGDETTDLTVTILVRR